jgi:hypothetical protein
VVIQEEDMKTKAVSSRSLFSHPETGELCARMGEEIWDLNAGDRVSCPNGIFELVATAADHWKLERVNVVQGIAAFSAPITAKNFHRRAGELSPRDRITLARELGII